MMRFMNRRTTLTMVMAGALIVPAATVTMAQDAGVARAQNAGVAVAQDAGVQVWGVRVLATDAEAIAAFYEKAFGMSEVARPVNAATTKEILLNFGATPEIAKASTATPIVIYTRPATAPAGAMASLIIRVPDLEAAIERVKAAGGTQLRSPGRNAVVNVRYAFMTDPDGNQIELVAEDK
jgi:predicted enzyme related to lactoylglutathione lyase